MYELIKIRYENGKKKEIKRNHVNGTPAMDILITMNKQGHGVKSVTIKAV